MHMANSTPTLVPTSLNPAKHPDACLTAVLALDLGTHTGWALWQADRSTTSGTAHFAPQRFEGGGMRYLRFKRWLAKRREKLSRVLGKRALKSFHPRSFNARLLAGVTWSDQSGNHCRTAAPAFC